MVLALALEPQFPMLLPLSSIFNHHPTDAVTAISETFVPSNLMQITIHESLQESRLSEDPAGALNRDSPSLRWEERQGLF